ncbi:MAG: hypothetical protein ACQES1_10210 [Bacteroidota bacterium]
MKKRLNTALMCFLFVIVGTGVLYAQTDKVYMKDKTDWKDFEEQNGVVFSQKVVEYHDNINDQHKEFYLVRITNTTNENMRIQAKRTLWYDGKCFNCEADDDEYKLDIKLPAGEEITGDPVKNRNNALVIFKKFLKYPDIKEVTKFEFQNLTVKLN